MIAQKTDIRVSLASFEGPLDLLLYLARQNEIDIRNIKIGEITEQYLRALDLMREYNLDIAGDFILMSATLILIKSRRLLPKTDEENPNLEDEEAETKESLIRRLLEHQRFQEVAQALKEKPRLGSHHFKRPPPTKKPRRKYGNFEEMSLTELSLSFQNVLLRNRRPVRWTIGEILSVMDAALDLHEKLSTEENTDFYSCFPENANASTIIATFLAILELAKLQKIRILQHTVYGSIHVILREPLSRENIKQLFTTGESYEYKKLPEVSGGSLAVSPA